MTNSPTPIRGDRPDPQRRLFNRPSHRPRPLRYWVLALAAVVAAAVLLPRLVDKLG